MLTIQQLQALAPAAGDFVTPLNHYTLAWEIDTPQRLAMFLAQCAHESQGFRHVEENLNYGTLALWEMFHKHFDSMDQAASYARQPERIANRIYANRLGNGDEASGDGWRFRGRGIIQVTGRSNYLACSHALFGDDRLIDAPEQLAQVEAASGSAAWFWGSNGLNDLADAGDFVAITKRINGGLTGLQDRQAWLVKAREALGLDLH